MRSMRLPLLTLLAAAALSGCSLFKADAPKPAVLEAYTPSLKVATLWRGRIDNVGFPMAIATPPGLFVVAGDNGEVAAFDAATGQEKWRGSAKDKLSAGVGSDGRYAAVVTRDGELVVLDSGKPLWRKNLGRSVTSAPLVAGERVFVLGVDRTVHAYDAQDGQVLWEIARPGDPLTLSQRSVIAPFKNTLLVSQGPRMAGLDPTSGNVRWEVAVASPRGTNEVERLADLVGPAARVGDVVCARSFQVAVGCVNAERGSLIWSKTVGGTEGVSADEQLVFGGDASDRISAWKTGNGDVVWASDKLLHHDLSAPVALPKAVVFGSADGTLHFLSRETGSTVLRMPTDGSAVAVAPVLVNGTLLVVTRNGGVFALKPE